VGLGYKTNKFLDKIGDGRSLCKCTRFDGNEIYINIKVIKASEIWITDNGSRCDRPWWYFSLLA
jgi:hypothetical protein